MRYVSLSLSFFLSLMIFTNPRPCIGRSKKNLISLEKLSKNQENLAKIPHSPSYKHPHEINSWPHEVALIKPFFDPITHQTLSAGTRFILDTTKQAEQHAAVFVYDPKVSGFKTSFIPRDRLINLQTRPHAGAISCFVSLLKQWAHCINGPIPYVWGGSSFTHCCNHPFREVKKDGKWRARERI